MHHWPADTLHLVIRTFDCQSTCHARQEKEAQQQQQIQQLTEQLAQVEKERDRLQARNIQLDNFARLSLAQGVSHSLECRSLPVLGCEPPRTAMRCTYNVILLGESWYYT